MEIELDPKQAEAVATCCKLAARIVAVTGQAGTGKTTIMRQVYDLLTDKGYRVALAAPTGKAAKRIQEATNIAATTIHRLLEYSHPGDRDPKTGKVYGISTPQRNAYRCLDHDVVLVDEYAMVHHELHRALIDSLPGKGAIRAFGDINQLPPIEPSQHLMELPSPFTDILHRFTGIKLETIHRQGVGSGIVENGQRINRGITPVRKPDFDIITTDEPIQKLEHYLFEGAGKDCKWDSIRHQIITPTNKGWTGTYALNQFLQRLYRREKDGWLELPRHEWHAKLPLRVHVGDKVIYEVNNYGLELFNGEGGIVEEITEFGEIVVDLGDRHVTIPPIQEYLLPNGDVRQFDPRRDLQLGYAITTHKAQGSEYDTIIYVLNKSSFFVQLRSNFYTAITRARERACLIGDIRSIAGSVQRTKPYVPKVAK
jgi:exodeoxyribonuclease V alpha subunit